MCTDSTPVASKEELGPSSLLSDQISTPAAEDADFTAFEEEPAGEDASQPKAVLTVDARVSALKALAGISTVVSKSRRVDAEALQQIKQQRARAKAEQAAGAGGNAPPGAFVEAAVAGGTGPALMADPLKISGTLRSVSFDAGVRHANLLRHLSAPPSAPSTSSPLLVPGDSSTPLPVGSTAAATLSGANGGACFPPQQGGYAAPPPPQPASVPVQLLRPQRSLPATISSAQHLSGAPATASVSSPFRAHTLAHSGNQAAQVPAQQQQQQPRRMTMGDAVAAAAAVGLPPPPFADLLPTLSFQELLSLRAAVEGLLSKHAVVQYQAMPFSDAPPAHQQLPQAMALQQQQQQSEHALQQVQHAEHAYQQFQQAQRAQQAAAILHSLSAAAGGGGSSGLGTNYSPPQQQQQPHPAQQPLTPSLSFAEEHATLGSSSTAAAANGRNFSLSDGTPQQGSGSHYSLSPATSGPLGDQPAAEKHLLGNSLSSVLDAGASALRLAEVCNSWSALDSDGALPRSVSYPTDPLIATARSASLSGYLGSENVEVAALLHSLNLNLTPWREEEQQLPTPSLAGGSGAAQQPMFNAILPQPGLGLPLGPRPAYRSVQFRGDGTSQPPLPPLKY